MLKSRHQFQILIVILLTFPPKLRYHTAIVTYLLITFNQTISYSYISLQIPDMMDICERRYGRYEWGTYDIILSPPGYSFEGMEFPQMNYISVSLIDFDKTSGPNYIYATWLAHEMIHSWFGDVVTPKYASDAWLSEGITQYGVSEVLEEYYGDPKIGAYLRHWRYSYLKNTFDFYTGDRANKKILTPYMYNQHPFSGFSSISYNKGALFLEYIATHTGRSKLAGALRKYQEIYKYHSVDTADFVHVLYEEFRFESERDIERECLCCWRDLMLRYQRRCYSRKYLGNVRIYTEP